VVRGLTKHGGASAAMASSPEPVEHAAMHGSVGFLHKNDVATRGVLTQWSLMASDGGASSSSCQVSIEKWRAMCHTRF
jgi:hypothetical protein